MIAKESLLLMHNWGRSESSMPVLFSLVNYFSWEVAGSPRPLRWLFHLRGGWETKTIEVVKCCDWSHLWSWSWWVKKAKSQMAVPRGEMFDWNVGPNLTEVCHRSCAVKVGIQAPFRVSPALWSQISILCRKSLICKDTKVSPTEVMILGSGSGSGRAVTLYQVLRNPR